ncbi:MAG: hypothetical protein RL264_1608 [Bacteroidota bacterium]|jgi:hypothetical protein
MKKSIFFFVMCFIVLNSFSQTPVGIQWQKCFGGSNNDKSYSVISTSDGGFISVGSTSSNNGNVFGNHSSGDGVDVWVIKTTSNGVLEWQKCFGGSGLSTLPGFSDLDWDIGFSIIQTADGGYIFCGMTSSINGDVSGNDGSIDAWIVKINSTGIIQWQKCFGGSDDDIAIDIIQTNDGGYIFAGYTFSNNGDVSGNHGNVDVWVVKLSSTGLIQWQKCYGGTNDESFGFDLSNIKKEMSLNATLDGGYIISGATNSSNGDVSNNNGQYDAWLVKINSTGVLQWQKCIGGQGNEVAVDILQTDDGGYIFSGYTNSSSGDVIGNHGGNDILIVKLNSTGTIQWQKCFGGQYDEYSFNIQKTLDGNFIIVGSAEDLNSSNNFSTNVWVIKINSIGNLIWQRSMGGSGVDIGYSIKESTFGQYILSGSTTSSGLVNGDVSGSHDSSSEFNSETDVWLVKLIECNTSTNSSSVINISSCSNYTTPTGQVLTSSGTYVNVIPNHVGCDSTITINYLKYPSVTNNVIINTCALPYIWNGQSYNNYGNHTQILQTIYGCDSVVNLSLQYFPIPNSQNICLVSVNPSTGKNKVVWEKEQTQVIEQYKIYRENTQSGSFDLIGTTNYSDSSVFEDALSNTSQQAYRYQIKYVDTCGNESSVGDTHKTLHLTINQGVGSTWNLIWTAYEGVSFPSYNIYRGTNSSNMTLINTVASNITSYTDNNAPTGFVYYQIEILGPNCTPTKSPYNNSKSNISTNDPTYLGINENLNNQISIAPNPTTSLTTLTVSQEFIGKSFSITDFAGRVVLQGKIQSLNQTIDLQKVARGSYILTVENTNLPGFKIIKE